MCPLSIRSVRVHGVSVATSSIYWYFLLVATSVWQAVSNTISKIDIQWVNYLYRFARVSITGPIMNLSNHIIYGLAQDSWNSSALVMELLQSCTKSSIWEWLHILCCKVSAKSMLITIYIWALDRHYNCKSQISIKPHITKRWNIVWTFHEPVYKHRHALLNDSRWLFHQGWCLVVKTKPLRVHT